MNSKLWMAQQAGSGAEGTSRRRPLVVVAQLTTYAETVPRVLQALDAGAVLATQKRILLKPNLIEDRPAPITTDVKCVEAVVAFCRKVSPARIVVADGAGGCETNECFSALGYDRLKEQHGVELLDLNRSETVTLRDASNFFLKEFHIPKILLESYVVSIPVLKAHSMTRITLSMKNMIGVAPERYYRQEGHYKKSGLHEKLDRAILELNKLKKPDLTLIDAAVGMVSAHLWGPRCHPPVGKLVGSYDPVAADKVGCELLGKDWRRVEHIVLADGVIGQAEGEVRFI